MAIQAELYPENSGLPFCDSQDWMDNNARGIGGFNDLYFNLQQHQQQKQPPYMQQQHLQNLQFQQRSQNICLENSALLPRNNPSNFSMASYQSILTQFDDQRQNIDRFIRLQNERLRLALHEQRKQELASLFKKFESRAQFLLRKKDEQIAQALNRGRELEGYMKRMETESQAWQTLAKENEAMVMSLNNTIEELRENGCLRTNGVQDAESWCDDRGGGDRKQSGNDNYERRKDDVDDGDAAEQEERKMVCKSCNCRGSCVIFLPCRHLCSCKPCESFLNCCPVCGIVKISSIQALI